MDEFEKQAEIRALRNLLEQNDYTARKVVFEVAAKLRELHPELSMPIYDEYLEAENKANGFRTRINELNNS